MQVASFMYVVIYILYILYILLPEKILKYFKKNNCKLVNMLLKYYTKNIFFFYPKIP